MKYFDQAQWIWCAEAAEVNAYVVFTQQFSYTPGKNRAILRISADSQYEVVINGDRVGAGQYADYPEYKVFDEYDVTEFLTVVGNVYVRGNPFGKLDEDGFHHIFLRVGDQPMPKHAFRILFDKFVLLKDDLFFLFFVKEGGKIASERGQNICQRGDRGAVEVVFKLRNVSFGQFAPIGKLFLGQPLLVSHLFYFFS